MIMLSNFLFYLGFAFLCSPIYLTIGNKKERGKKHG
jgi:hypothetical protein